MNRRALALTFVLVLLFSAVGFWQVNFVSANFVVKLPYITIQSDGSIEPQTEFINKVGDTYFLTANLSQYAILIKCSNIIFDGQGHSINGTVSSGGHGFGNSGLGLVGVTNVTVQTVEVMGFMGKDIVLSNCHDCTVLNVKAADVELDNSTSNILFQNDFSVASPISGITRLYISFSNNNTFYSNNISTLFFNDSENNTFFQNNFLSLKLYLKISQNFWSNGSTGNYWSDYLEKYPDASEISNTSIGDTPYVIDANNVDHHPLMVPFEQLPTSRSLTAEAQTQNESVIIPALIGVFSAVVLVKSVSLLVYLKKRNN